MAVAKYLESSPYVVEVRYPGKWVLPIIIMLLLCVCKAEPFDLSFHQYVCVRADNGCGPGGTSGAHTTTLGHGTTLPVGY